MFNSDYVAEAYDVTCRVCDDWHFENVDPTIAMMHLMRHSRFHSPSEIGEMWWALRIVEGYEGLSEETPVRTPEDGWNRPPTLKEVRDDE
ncbi:MAG: hypothetical protein ACOCS7_03200 [Halolamina sp.]